ncbi:MAG: hypothetical protein ACFFCS_26400, partial [Candidatus Hodarchaeota archaeon]
MEQRIETLSLEKPKGWTDKAVLKQGFCFSLIFQFVFITLSYVVWKPYHFPGTISGVGDILVVILLSMGVIGLISMIFSLNLSSSKKKVSKKSLVMLFQIMGIAANAFGFILILYSLYPGMNYTLNAQIEEDYGLIVGLDALLPSMLLVGTVVAEAFIIMVLVMFLDVKKEDFGKACVWGLVFMLIPIATGFISFTNIILPGGMYLPFFASTIMFGISIFMINPSSMKIIERKGARNMEQLVESSPAVETTSYNITGYLFLIPYLMFHYFDPLFSNNPLLSPHTVILLLLPIAVAAGVVILSRTWGDSRLHGRLLAGVAVNIMLVFLIVFRYLRAYNKWLNLVPSQPIDWIYNDASNESLGWAYAQAALVGVG